MSFSPVFLLVAVALAMAVFLPLFGKRSRFSSSWRSRRHRRVVLGRIAVVALLLATLVTTVMPIAGLHSLVQGVLLTAAIIVPAWLVLELIGWKAVKDSSHLTDGAAHATDEDAAHTTDEEPDAGEPAYFHSTDTESSSRSKSLDLGIPTLTTTRRATDRSSDPTSDTGRDPVGDQKRAEKREQLRPAAAVVNESAVQSPSPAEATAIKDLAENRLSIKTNQDSSRSTSLLEGRPSAAAVQNRMKSENEADSEEVNEQLNRVSEMVQSHDLADPELSVEPARPDTQQSPSGGTDLLVADVASTDLSTMSTGQIKHLVTNLRRDKTRLQKLVIAQQSAIQTERRAHEQSRTVARDAIVIMRDARSSQKLAEKLARRERSERQRVEQQYKKVAKALNNAMSIIEQRKQTDKGTGAAGDNKSGASSSIEDILG